MTTLDDQYTNETDNKDDEENDVEDIHPGDKLVNYFNNGFNYNNDVTMKMMMMITIETWVIMTMCMPMLMKEQDST